MITTLYAAILAFIYVGLSLYVILGRWKYKIGLGDGGQKDLARRVRMHGNFAEYVPLALLLLFFLDHLRYSPAIIHLLGIVLVVARLAHAQGLYSSDFASVGRSVGMVGTLSVILIMAAMLLWRYVAVSALQI